MLDKEIKDYQKALDDHIEARAAATAWGIKVNTTRYALQKAKETINIKEKEILDDVKVGNINHHE